MTASRLAHSLDKIELPLAEFLRAIPALLIKQRKPILSLCRMQMCPRKGTLARSRLWKDLQFPLQLHRHHPPVDCLEFLSTFSYLESPLYSGFISMCLRNFPFPNDEEVNEVLRTGILKEVSAGMEKYLPRTFNWAVIMSPNFHVRHTTPIAPGYPLQPEIHDFLHSSIQRAIFQLHGSTLFPDYSTKTIGRRASHNVRQDVRNLLDSDISTDILSGLSTLDLERLYHRSGMIYQGETEIRSSWKYNDLKPRMYYARGPDVYYASRYIQQIFNILVDSLEVCHRHLRYAHHTIRFDRLWTAFIYDYSSFTSTLDAVTDFVFALAEMCDSTPINLVDTHHGIITLSLGEVLRDFNRICQQYPSFDMSEIEGFPLSDDFIVTHTCGMLGVPGNISSCTFVHAIHLILILGHLLCKVVGDDAFGAGDLDPEDDDLVPQLQGIGKLAEEKVERWPPEDKDVEDAEYNRTWEYTKRPFIRVLTRINVGTQVIFPPLAQIACWKDKHHTLHEEPSVFARKRKAVRSLQTFMLQLDLIVLDDDDRRFANWFLREALHQCGVTDRNGQVLPELSVLILPIPYISVGSLGDNMVETYWNKVVTLGVEFSDDNPEVFEGRREEFVARSSKALKLARDLGYAHSDPIMVSFVVRDDPDRFLGFVNRSKGFRPLYRSYVDSSCPDWLQDMIFRSLEDDPVPDRIVEVDLYDEDDSDLELMSD